MIHLPNINLKSNRKSYTSLVTCFICYILLFSPIMAQNTEDKTEIEEIAYEETDNLFLDENFKSGSVMHDIADLGFLRHYKNQTLTWEDIPSLEIKDSYSNAILQCIQKIEGVVSATLENNFVIVDANRKSHLQIASLLTNIRRDLGVVYKIKTKLAKIDNFIEDSLLPPENLKDGTMHFIATSLDFLNPTDINVISAPTIISSIYQKCTIEVGEDSEVNSSITLRVHKNKQEYFLDFQVFLKEEGYSFSSSGTILVQFEKNHILKISEKKSGKTIYSIFKIAMADFENFQEKDEK